MDLTFSPEDETFRQEVKDFVAEHYTAQLRDKSSRSKNGYIDKEDHIQWQKALDTKGWATPNWPVEHGGPGFTPTQKYIFSVEMAREHTPHVVPFGITMVAPVIMKFGTEEQKKRFLPDIKATNVWWCQGYSEPGSGSDLASLQMKAERDGDHYVLNGSKIWTSVAQHADWIFCLVRTSNEGKRQEGISFVLVDMKTPGITVNPIHSIDNQHTLNEVLFDNVRVPQANRIGEQDKGWTYAKSLLAHERTSIAGVPESKRKLRELRALLETEVSGGKSLADDVLFQNRLSNVEIELMALEYTELRVLSSTVEGKGLGVESSLLKLKGTEIQQSIQQLTIDLAGNFCGVIQGELSTDELGHGFGDRARREYMYGRAATIYGGSDEVQKNITAKYVLGL